MAGLAVACPMAPYSRADSLCAVREHCIFSLALERPKQFIQPDAASWHELIQAIFNEMNSSPRHIHHQYPSGWSLKGGHPTSGWTYTRKPLRWRWLGRAAPEFRGEIANRPKAIAKLVEQLNWEFGGEVLRFAYEADPCGYGLYRQLVGLGHDCEVVAPSLIPRVEV